MSVEQLEQLLATLHEKPDAKVAEQLETVQLSERVSLARLTRWEADFPGKRAHQDLVKLADMSAFLELPKTDLVTNPGPDVDAQKRMLWQAMHYVNTTTSRLPNLFATRQTTHFQTIPAQDTADVSLSRVEMRGPTTATGAQGIGTVPRADLQALHSKGEYLRSVTYRDGHEVLDTGKGSQDKGDEPEFGLTTNGEFGPILATVMGDAMHGSFRWLRWVDGATGPVAEFFYAVPQAQSHYRVGITDAGTVAWSVFARSVSDTQRQDKELYPAYHGVLDMDPVTGAILHLSLVTDVTSFDPLQSAIVVEYAPVTMGVRSFVCAVRSVAFLKVRLPIVGATPGAMPVAAMPVQISLNDAAFTHYHLFGSEVTIRANAAAESTARAVEPGPTHPPAALATEAAATSYKSAIEAGATPVSNPLPASERQTEVKPVATNAITAATSNAQAEAAPPATVIQHLDTASTLRSTNPEDMPAPSVSAESSASTTAPAPGLVLHVQSHLVLVDVVITDHNQPVHGLDRGRVHIFQDNHEQAITSFDEVDAPSETPDAARMQSPALSPNTYSNVPVLPQTGTVNVILLDALNTDASDQLYARREMIRSLQALPPGRSVAVFTLALKLRLLQGFTTDTGKAVAALAGKSAGGPASLRPPVDQEAEQRAELDRITDAGVSGLDMATFQNFMSEGNQAQTKARMELTVEALQVLARYLSGIPGRKNLVWLSGSFPLQFFAKGGDPLKQMDLNVQGTFAGKVRATADLLAAARVAVYPVDARGVLGQSMFSAAKQPQNYSRSDEVGSSLGGGQNRFAEDTAMGQLQTSAEHRTMDILAQDTGGRAVYDSNGLQKAFAEALSDGSNYYALSYVPPQEKAGTGGATLHQLEMKIDGGKYQLAYRRAFYTEGTAAPANSAGTMPPAVSEATVLGAPLSTQIQFQARVLPASGSRLEESAPNRATAGDAAAQTRAGARAYVVDLNVASAGLTFTPGMDMSERAQVGCALVAYDAEGKVVNTLGRTLTFRFSPQQYSHLQVEGGTVPVRLALDLPTGKLALRIVIYNSANSNTGSLEIPVLVTSN